MRFPVVSLLSAVALAAVASAPAAAALPAAPSPSLVEHDAGTLSPPNFQVWINGGAMRYTGAQPLTPEYSYTIGQGSGSLGGRGRSAIRLDHQRRDLNVDWIVFRLGKVIGLSGGSVNGNGTVFATLRARVTKSTWGRCLKGKRGTVSLFDGGLLEPDKVTFHICGFDLEYESFPGIVEVSVTIGQIATNEPPPSGEPF